MAKLYPVSPPSLFPPLVNTPQIQLPLVRPPKLTGSNYNYSSPGSNYYNYYRRKNKYYNSNEYVNDLGDIVLGDLIYGTKELQNTLKKYGHEDWATVPLLNRAVGLVDAVDDRFIRPFREDKLGIASEKMLINSLETIGNSMDILSNPVKALLGVSGNGDNWNDFLRSMGWKEGEYRENYNWDTDIDNGILKFLVDLGLEVISDPTTIASIAGGLAKNAAEKGVLESSKLAFKDIVDDIAVQFRHLKTEDEIIESLARFGITDDNTLTRTLLRIVEKNPDILEQQATKRVQSVQSTLSEIRGLVALTGDEENMSKVMALMSQLDNESLLNTTFYNRITKLLEDLKTDVNFKRYYGATRFMDNVKKLDNAITVSSLAMAPQLPASVYIGKQAVNKTKEVISQNYLQRQLYKRAVAAAQDIRRKTYDYTKAYKALAKKRATYEFFNNRFNLEEIHERLIDYVRTSPFKIRSDELSLRKALEKKAEDLLFRDNKHLRNLRQMVPEYREFLSKLSKAKYDTLPDVAKVLVDDVREYEILMSELRKEINNIVDSVEDLAETIIKTREEQYTTLLIRMKSNKAYTVYNAIDEMFKTIAKDAGINVEDTDALKELLSTITKSDTSPIRAVLEQMGIVESNYADILKNYLDVKESRLKTQRLYKTKFKNKKYTEDLVTNHKDTKEYKRYLAYLKADSEQTDALKILKENQLLSFGEFLEKSGFIPGKSLAAIQDKRVAKGMKNLNKALDALKRTDFEEKFKPTVRTETVGKEGFELTEDAFDELVYLKNTLRDVTDYSLMYNVLGNLEIPEFLNEEVLSNLTGTELYKYFSENMLAINSTIKNLDTYLDLHPGNADAINIRSVLEDIIEEVNKITKLQESNTLHQEITGIKHNTKPIEDLAEMLRKGQTFQTIQYNKTDSLVRLAESAIAATETYFPNFYGNRYKYLDDFKRWINVTKKLDPKKGAYLEQNLFNFYISYVQTNAFLRYFMGEMDLTIVPEQYQNLFRLQLHDTIYRLSKGRNLGASANEITDAIVTDLKDLLEVIAKEQNVLSVDDFINIMNKEVIKPQVQRYLKELAKLKSDVASKFKGRINRNIKFYNIIDKETIDSMERLGPVLTNLVKAKLPEADANTILEVLNALAGMSKLVPTVDPRTLEELLGMDGTVTSQNETMAQLIKGMSKSGDSSWLGEVKITTAELARRNNEFKDLRVVDLPSDLIKDYDRLEELAAIKLNEPLNKKQQMEYQELRKKLKLYLMPRNFYKTTDVKDITGMWAPDLARNTNLGTYNYLNAHYYADRLHLDRAFWDIPARETYDALQFVHEVEQTLKTVIDLDTHTIGYNAQLNEYLVNLYDYMIKNSDDLMHNKHVFPEFKYLVTAADPGPFGNLEVLDEQAKRAVMFYIKENHSEFYEGIKEHMKLIKPDKTSVLGNKGIKTKIEEQMDKQSNLISFLLGNSYTKAQVNAVEQDDLTPIYRMLDETDFVKYMKTISTGVEGVNKDILTQMSDDLDEAITALKNQKISTKELTTQMNTAYAVGISHLTPEELQKYIATVNNEYNYILVNTAYKVPKNLNDAGIKAIPLVKGNKSYGYMLVNTRSVEQATQKEFNTIVGKIGSFENPVTNVVKKYAHYLPYMNSTKEGAIDLSGLYQFYTGHTLNRNVTDAVSNSKAIKDKGVINLIDEDQLMHKADFVHMIDAQDYNYFVSTLMDVIQPELMDSAFRKQDYVLNTAKGLTQAVKHKDNGFKAIDLFFQEDSAMANVSDLVNVMLKDDKIRHAFYKDNNTLIQRKRYVPVILVQDAKGNPQLHRVFINSDKVYLQFLDKGGKFVAPEIYKFMINNINKVNATGIRRILYQFLKPMYAMAYLTNPGFLMRNAIDTLLVKNSMSTDNIDDIPKILMCEAQAAHELKTYKDCWQQIYKNCVDDATALGKSIKDIRPNFYDINRAYQTWDLPTKLTFLKITIWKDTSAAADLSSEVLDLFGTGKINPTLSERLIQRVSELPPMSWVTNVNSDIEQIGRLGLYNYNTLYKGMNPNKALDEVIKTHFDYQVKDMGMEYLRDLFMFETFPINNVLYYLDIGLNRNPEILKFLLDVDEQSWNTAGLTWDDVKNNTLLRRQVLMGNIKIGDYIIKTGSSLMDFLNVVGAPLEAVKERSNPLIRAVTQRDLNQANPFMAYPNRLRQIRKFIDTKGKEGSILPSVYSKFNTGAKTYKRSRTRTSYVKWTKYPKIRKPHKNYIRNYRFYTKPYYFKRPNTLAWATSNSRWNIRPTYKRPRGARYYIRRYIGNPEYLTKFGPEDI